VTHIPVAAGVGVRSGSAYYQTYDNFFAFAANGLKSDFNGHDNRHFRNGT
jgi:hypothetical protein